MTNLTPVLTDAASLRKKLHEKTVGALSAAFPLDLKGRTLEVHDVKVHAQDYSPTDEYHALMKGSSLNETVKGTLVLKDTSGKVVDTAKNFTLAHIPYITSRHSLIADGNEYQVANQLRRKPGVYTQRSENGELKTVFNLGRGKNFDLTFNDAKGTFHLQYGTSNLPLYAVLRGMGVGHDHIANKLGEGVAKVNEEEHGHQIAPTVAKLYTKLEHPALLKPNATHEEKVQAIKKRYDIATLDPDVTHMTLGHAHDKVTPDALLAAAKKILQVHKGETPVDDTDALTFKTFHSMDDFIAERIRLTSRVWAPKAKMALHGKNTIREALKPAPFSDAIRKFLTTSSLSSVPTGINPMEILDHSVKVTSLGEGGIPSDRAIPLDARMIHNTQFGALDPIRTPESSHSGVDIRATIAAHRDDKGNLYTVMRNVKTGKDEYVRSGDLNKMVVAFPHQELKGHVDVFHKGEQAKVDASKVTHQLNHLAHVYSPATTLIPFIHSIQGNRAIMGSKMGTQALPLLEREAPLVQVRSHLPEGHSFEQIYGHMIVPRATVSGTVAKVDKDYVYIRPHSEKKAEDRPVIEQKKLGPHTFNLEMLRHQFEDAPGTFTSRSGNWDYGHLPGYVGPDGDSLDFFVGDKPDGHIFSFHKQKSDDGGKTWRTTDIKYMAGMSSKDKDEFLRRVNEYNAIGPTLRYALPKQFKDWNHLQQHIDEHHRPEKTAADPVQHIMVTGHSGAGKSTYAKSLAEQTGLPLYRFDEVPGMEEAMLGTDHEKVHQLQRAAVADSLKNFTTPHIMEGTALLTSPELMKGHRVVLMDAPRDALLKARLERMIRKALLRGRPADPERRHAKGVELYNHYEPMVDTFRKMPGVEVRAPGYVPTTKEAADLASAVLHKSEKTAADEKPSHYWGNNFHVYWRPGQPVPEWPAGLENEPTIGPSMATPYGLGNAAGLGGAAGAAAGAVLGAGVGKLLRAPGAGAAIGGVAGGLLGGAGSAYKQHQRNTAWEHASDRASTLAEGLMTEHDAIHPAASNIVRLTDLSETGKNYVREARKLTNQLAAPWWEERDWAERQAAVSHTPASRVREYHLSSKTAADKDEKGLVKVPYHQFFPFPSKTFLHHDLDVKPGDKVQEGQRLGDSNYTRKGTLALGKNLLVGYMPYYGFNSNDAVVISEACSKKLTSEHMYREVYPVTAQIELNKEKHRMYYGTKYPADVYAKLDADGVIKKGSKVNPKDLLVCGLTKQQIVGTDAMLGRISKALAKPYKEVCLTWGHGAPGEVIDVVRTASQIAILVRTHEHMQVGDKLAGRYGNKGVVAKIVPDHEMLRDEQGRPIDLLLTSAGVVSRINPAQVIETAVSKVAEKTGKPIVYDNAAGHNAVKWAKDLMQTHGVKDKEHLFDPVLNRKIAGGDGKGVLVGRQYIYKLFKSTDTNFAGHGVGPYDLNEQPMKTGGDDSAKGIGKMEFDALLAHNARNFLREAATVKGQKNDEFWKAVQTGLPLPQPKPSFAFNKFTTMLEGSGIKVDKRGSKITLLPLTDHDVLKRSAGVIENNKTIQGKDLKPEKGGLFDPIRTGGNQGTLYSHIELHEPIPNPVFKEPVRRLLGMTEKEFDKAVHDHGGAWFKSELQKIDVPKRIDALRTQMKTAKGPALNDVVKQIKYLEALQKNNLQPHDAYIVSKIPVIPPIFRPILPGVHDPSQLMVADANKLYGQLMDSTSTLKRTALESDRGKHRLDVYNKVEELYGVTLPQDPKMQQQKVKGFLATVAGVGTPKGGFFQRKLMRHTQDVSGRGTAVPDANLNMDEVGIPEQMLWQMLDKLVVARLIRKGYPALQAREMVNNKVPAAHDALMEESRERPVWINRAPTLHRWGIIAAYPKPVKGKTIRVSPFIEQGMNLDYDGDTLQVHVPVTADAVHDAKNMTMTNLLLSDQQRNRLMAFPQHEAIIGFTHAAKNVDAKGPVKKFKNREEVLAAWRRGELKMSDAIEVENTKHAEETEADNYGMGASLPSGFSTVTPETALSYFPPEMITGVDPEETEDPDVPLPR
jgi:DNA-directed RNA polymerase beta subunit